jgi:large subunit ribosomal protein L9
MEVILLQDVEKVGDKHEIVNVRDGYGRNFLIPQKLAIVANKGNRARLDDLRKQESSREAKMLGHYQELANSLKDKVLKIGAKAGTTGKIFGSVTNQQLALALKEQFNVEIERKKITLPEEVKVIGSYHAVLHFHPQVETHLAFEVVQE